MIKTVIFDVGRVLIDVNLQRGLFRYFVGSAVAETDASLLQEQVTRLMQEELIMEYNCGRMGPQEFYHRVNEKYGLGLTEKMFFDAWCDVFSPMPGMEALVRELQKKVNVGCLSDTDPVHWRFLEARYPFIKEIVHQTLSFRVGARKPEARIYEAALEKMRVKAESCLYVDDLAVNVAGARRAGMRAVQFSGAVELCVFLHSEDLLDEAELATINAEIL